MSNTSTLSKKEIPHERFQNRSEWMNNQFKDNNTESLDWIPEIILHINPAPTYHDEALKSANSHQGLSKRRYSEGMEKFKNGLIKKNMMEEKTQTGRLYAHLKHIEMKNTITNIKR